jgi:hypothetical protein
MSINLLVFAALVLVPIIPAFLFFKFIRSRARVSGSLSGLTISLGGAFGGYFALMLFLTSQFGPALLHPTMRTWKISGQVRLAPHDSQPVVGTVFPPIVGMAVDGKTFTIEVPVTDGDALPKVLLQAPQYESETIDLETLKKGSVVNERGGIVTMQLATPINLTRR